MKVKKLDWFLILSSVLVVWFIDAITKQMALAWVEPNTISFYGLLGFVIHRNPGTMLGAFSDLPAVLRIVTLCTGGAFLVFFYGVIQYLLPMRSMVLRIGMSFLLGGILGNVTDRTLWGSVVDFLVIGRGNLISPAFNIADAIQWVGYGLVVFGLIRDGHLLWPDKNTRKRIWVNPRFQIKYILVLVCVGLAFSFIGGIFSYTYIKVMIDEIVIGNPVRVEMKFLTPFIYTFMLISFGFLVFLCLVGRVVSHRTAGPLYAFELFLEDLLNGKDRPLKLRAHDEFQHLEELANKMRNELRHTHMASITPTPEAKPDITQPNKDSDSTITEVVGKNKN